MYPMKEGQTISKAKPKSKIYKKPRRLQFRSSVYCTISDGKKRVYTDAERMEGYDRILAPGCVAMINFFINGMLQPPMNYKVYKGRFRLRTSDIPGNGIPISIQFIRLGVNKRGGDKMPVIKPVYTATSTAPVFRRRDNNGSESCSVQILCNHYCWNDWRYEYDYTCFQLYG
jgi:hypothetical protein